MYVSTFAFVLAAIVVSLAVAAALTFAVSAISTSRTLRHEWQTSKPAKVAAELEGLREELLAHKRVMRAELGRIWQRLPRAALVEPARAAPVSNGEMPLEELDPDLAAELALQRAPAVSPGTRG